MARTIDVNINVSNNSGLVIGSIGQDQGTRQYPRIRTAALLDALNAMAKTRKDWFVSERQAFSFRIITEEGGTFVVSVDEVD